MPPERSVIDRGPWWPRRLAPVTAFAVAWWFGWGPFVALGCGLAALIVATIVQPRRPGRWTE